MRAALPCAFLFLTLIAASAGAQTYDHVHLAAPEPAKAVEWYRAHLGAQPGDCPTASSSAGRSSPSPSPPTRNRARGR